MPKKTVSARSAAQRNKPKAKPQKSFELVRQTSDQQSQEQELETLSRAEANNASVSTIATPEVKQSERTGKNRDTRETAQSEIKPGESTGSEVTAAPKGSASARLAARRQAAQKVQQRASAALITAEHYAYVRKDLTFIGILAAIMFAAIIILHFVPGIGS